MDLNTTQNTQRDWNKLIQEASSSGLSKAEWCRRHNIKPKSLYYYEHKQRIEQESCATDLQTSFVEFTVQEKVTPVDASRPAIMVRFGKFQISIEDNTNEATLEMVLRALQNA